ncbi:MAG: Gfo/Idh/MocA family oxidoreductase [Candidatus Melainabacteria bacterium]|nr:Gfo/Idh/MocA family oxidoreductase [Candidatus Melainabacteria bacterium]
MSPSTPDSSVTATLNPPLDGVFSTENTNPPVVPPVSRVGVVGCGNWGKNLIRNFHHLGALAVVCDLNPSLLEAQARQFPDVAAVDTFEALLKHPELDGVVIATPSHTHARLALAALAAHKHVYVEKPLATSVAEAEAIQQMAVAQNRHLMVGHLLLYHPAAHRLRQLVQEGVLGEIRSLESDRLNYNPHRPDSSVLWDLAPHDISLMAYVLGADPEQALLATGQCTGTDQRVDDAHLEVAFPNGIRGHVHVSWVHPVKQVKLVVRGSRRLAVLDDTLSTEKLQLFEREDRSPESVLSFPEYLTIEPLKLECQHFLNCIRHNRAPRTDGRNGIRVVQILEQAHQLLSRSDRSL